MCSAFALFSIEMHLVPCTNHLPPRYPTYHRLEMLTDGRTLSTEALQERPSLKLKTKLQRQDSRRAYQNGYVLCIPRAKRFHEVYAVGEEVPDKHKGHH